MANNRRDFLKLAGLLSTGIALGPFNGFSRQEHKILNRRVRSSEGKEPSKFNMCGYRAPRLDVVRIGFVGLGNRGAAAVPRINFIDKVSIGGLCDVRPERVELVQASMKGSSHHPAIYTGNEDAWMKLC